MVETLPIYGYSEYILDSRIYLSNLLIFLIALCTLLAFFNSSKLIKGEGLSSNTKLEIDHILQVEISSFMKFVIGRIILITIAFFILFYSPLRMVSAPFDLYDIIVSIMQTYLWYLWANTIGVTLFVTILFLRKPSSNTAL
jgi:hypothetical protein